MSNTIDDLRMAFELFGVCTTCHRTELLDLDMLHERFGPDCPIAKVRDHVRCNQCGTFTRDIRIVYVGRCGVARGFHYRT